jgi:hypothetical protein
VALFSRFFGRTVSEGAAFAIGAATAPTLHPLIRDLANHAWENHAVLPLSPEAAAEWVAEHPDQLGWGHGEAAQSGIKDDRFDKLVDVADTGPGLPQLFTAWRRNLIDDAKFGHGLRKLKLETQWDAPLRALKQQLLTIDQLANARQQGFVTPQRQLDESELQGVANDRAQVLYELSGLPPGIETALDMWRRKIIGPDEFAQIVREGHTKTKYTDELKLLYHPILSADEFATLHLKGWISEAEMNDGGELHGYTAAQMKLKYQEKGRPAAPGQLWTAAARDIKGPADRPVDQAQFETAIKQSNIRPEYGPMLWGIRHLYPSLFQLTRLVSSGAIDAATGADWAKKARYAPEVVTALEKAWAQPKGTAGDTHVAKAQQQLWTATHRSYVNGEADETVVEDRLRLIGVPGGEWATIIELWTAERTLTRRQLTAAQIKKAYLKLVTNPETGQPWTRDDAIGALIELGYGSQDSATFLDTV